MSVKLRIHDAYQLLEGKQLFLHPTLIPQEILFLKFKISMN